MFIRWWFDLQFCAFVVANDAMLRCQSHAELSTYGKDRLHCCNFPVESSQGTVVFKVYEDSMIKLLVFCIVQRTGLLDLLLI